MISESDIKRIVKKVKSENINEGLFDTFFGRGYSGYANDLSKIMEDLISNVYYDKNLIASVKNLYYDIKDSNLDRRQKQELTDIIGGVYQTLESSKNNLEKYLTRLERLNRV